jgi:hypothetical protein
VTEKNLQALGNELGLEGETASGLRR